MSVSSYPENRIVVQFNLREPGYVRVDYPMRADYPVGCQNSADAGKTGPNLGQIGSLADFARRRPIREFGLRTYRRCSRPLVPGFLQQRHTNLLSNRTGFGDRQLVGRILR